MRSTGRNELLACRREQPSHELQLKAQLWSQATPAQSIDPPEGDVTLVFTDIQGSTVQWESDPDTMAHNLGLHNACMRELLRKHDGYEVKTEGDAFMCAFSDPMQAVRFCMDGQLQLLRQRPHRVCAPAAASRRATF